MAPRILISAPSLDASKNVSGVSSVVRQIIAALGDEFEFVHLELGSEQTGGKLSRKLRGMLKAGRALLTVAGSRYDVLHSNTALNTNSIVRDLAITALARLTGRRVVLHVHGGMYVAAAPDAPVRALLVALFAVANRIVMLSPSEEKLIVERFPQTRAKISHIYNGISLPPDTGPRSRAADGRLKVVFAGRLVPEKGIHPLLEALGRLTPDDGIDVDIYGAGPLQDLVSEAAARLPFVTFRGIFAPGESASVFANYDVIVLPSLNGEGMPMAIIEAMACGTVPVCTSMASIPEIIRHGETGYLIPSGDSSALVSQLREIAATPASLSTVSAGARAFARDHFDGPRNFGRFREHYLAGPAATERTGEAMESSDE